MYFTQCRCSSLYYVLCSKYMPFSLLIANCMIEEAPHIYKLKNFVYTHMGYLCAVKREIPTILNKMFLQYSTLVCTADSISHLPRFKSPDKIHGGFIINQNFAVRASSGKGEVVRSSSSCQCLPILLNGGQTLSCTHMPVAYMTRRICGIQECKMARYI